MLALAAYSQFEHGDSPFGRTVWVPLLYQALVVTPAILYLGLVHPDWTWLYLVDPARLPFGITILAVLATTVTLLIGYLVGSVLLRARRRRGLIFAVGVTAVGLGVAMVLLRGRLSHAGTYAAYATGEAARIAERKLGWSLSVITVGTLLGLAFSIRFLVAQGHREREG